MKNCIVKQFGGQNSKGYVDFQNLTNPAGSVELSKLNVFYIGN